ncbi:MAG: hypothetical protein NTY48_00820 [Candidatus Diapherotrites archaeon]|nr:hypothetical protein [Candidatus Diapherotrites archaeon]
MIDVKAELSPFRMVLARREPVELMVELINNSNKIQMVSLELGGGSMLAFDKGGRMRVLSKKIDSFKPGERIRDYYNVYPAANVEKGIETITILVTEHYNNSYQYVQSKKVKELTMRID